MNYLNYINVYLCSVILGYEFEFALENWRNKKFYKMKKKLFHALLTDTGQKIQVMLIFGISESSYLAYRRFEN